VPPNPNIVVLPEESKHFFYIDHLKCKLFESKYCPETLWYRNVTGFLHLKLAKL
jgi:hypothetical protein